MKIFKKIILSLLAVIVVVLLSGYFYFDQKFKPEANYLKVEYESGNVPIKWLGADKNVLLIPVRFPDDSAKYYLQFDTGSTYTVFYSKSVQHLKGITLQNTTATSAFYIGNTKITSDKIKTTDRGKVFGKDDSVKIIGTLGADILENRKTLINLKGNYVAFNMAQKPTDFQGELMDFKFKKRKIIMYGALKGKREKFLYDTGTSAYELLTNKENWESLKLPHSEVTVEKAQSHQNVLTTYTANSHLRIRLGNKEIPLTRVTYVEGFSQMQYMLMKFSGMTGMLGNKIFLNNSIYIDCTKGKIGVE
ncbi:hypothetical protein BAX97_14690 [Elizabethkingia meningoseptica]|uniref:hypothetical protein n=1 Tax=Elizabethkingia meningoseptica TaxID=238 RepID=UPI000332C5A9|nr:hypothetical protein [Elizabethkingia meningoseptica]AQX05391.1 hypothetical protein BBD33_09100 [Elizabethkingia meningoseptica]AQX47432.1 hypothetical protein B5G46_09090 [Elizabethkingia meningoseptica]EOR29176.1 hypothetical protein L100_12598 [Elizabethkingia meningoseptica ATCC 13253 = NBRC 12535]KUY24302.1 hypothetical protein ATB99_02015 [Elizabethkingia meningoseptica]OPB67499.1 hypothetical protein BAY30_08910 [Elizabethkingia meningoseptica]